MKHLLLAGTAVLTFTFSISEANAGGKEWCEENGVQMAVCIAGALTMLAIIASSSDDSNRGDYSSSSNSDDGDYAPPPGRNPIDEGLSDPLPEADYSSEFGCAWGSTATGNCH